MEVLVTIVKVCMEGRYTDAAIFNRTGRVIVGDSAKNYVMGGPVNLKDMTWYSSMSSCRRAGWRLAADSMCTA